MVMNDSFRIDFIGIGAAKSGTTWLADNLRNHPDVFIPEKKELVYFNKTMPFDRNFNNIKNDKPVSWYHDHFLNALPGQIKGEISPQYFRSAEAVKKIYQYHPGIKLLVMLRNPVEVAFSSYLYCIQIGAIKAVPFESAIKKHDFILNAGLYFKCLKLYIDQFPKKNINIQLFDKIKDNPKLIYKNVLDFLDLDEYYPDSLYAASNKTRQNKNQLLNYFITSSRKFIHTHDLHFLVPIIRYTGIAPIAEFIRDHWNISSKGNRLQQIPKDDFTGMLQDYYLEDINRLEDLILMDLSHWKTGDCKTSMP
jgi:hypothetical protein